MSSPGIRSPLCDVKAVNRYSKDVDARERRRLDTIQGLFAYRVAEWTSAPLAHRVAQQRPINLDDCAYEEPLAQETPITLRAGFAT